MPGCKALDTSAIKNSDSEGTSVEHTDQSHHHEITGAILYLSTHSRPHISATVNLLCRSSADPTKEKLIAAKRVLSYLKGTLNFALLLHESDQRLTCYADSD